jgi:hypothetical protein
MDIFEERIYHFLLREAEPKKSLAQKHNVLLGIFKDQETKCRILVCSSEQT